MAIVFQTAFGALLIALAPVVPWLAVAFLTAIPLGIWVARSLPGLTFPAIGLLAITGVTAPILVVDVPMWGRVVDLQQGDDIPSGVGISGYVAREWHIDMQQASDERLTDKNARNGYGYRRLAPLVSDDWKPQRPVSVWVYGEIRDSGRILPSHPQFWKEPGGEFVRLVGNQVASAQLAAGRSAEKSALHTPLEPLIVMWAPSVEQAIVDQYWALARTIRVSLPAWVIFLGIAAALIKWREARPSGRKLT